jgi:hypothetical protein
MTVCVEDTVNWFAISSPEKFSRFSQVTMAGDSILFARIAKKKG